MLRYLGNNKLNEKVVATKCEKFLPRQTFGEQIWSYFNT
jgi:hypothetical protein